jgi:hypothetical protein
MVKSITICDPPEGWRYGFPKEMPIDLKGLTSQQWFKEQGYPQSLIDQGMLGYVRYWTETIDE